MNIRKATLNDLKYLVEFNLNLALETENIKLSLEELEKGIEKVLKGEIQGKYFVCEIDGEVVGQMMLLYEWSDWRNGEFIWIQSVYVHKNYRKHGVFKALFKNVKSICDSDSKYVGLRLYVEKNNNRAKKVYEAMGMYENQYDMYEYSK